MIEFIRRVRVCGADSYPFLYIAVCVTGHGVNRNPLPIRVV